jgi:hypothetical protein
MAQLKHKFVSAKADGGDATLVNPSNWNDTHSLLWDVIRPAPAADQNDYAPAGFAAADVVLMAPTASVVITGFAATGINDGDRKTVRNDSADKLIVLSDESASSTAANRMKLSNGSHRGHYIIFPGDAVSLVYDATATRWVIALDVVVYRASWVRRAYTPQPGAATITNDGLVSPTTEVAVTAASIAGGTYIGSTQRASMQTSATAGSSAGIRLPNQNFGRGGSANFGGFLVRTRFGGVLNPANAGASFIGISSDTSSALGNVDASSLLSCIGVGTDATQSTFRLIHNDAAGVATATDLGANFPWSTTACYDFTIFSPPHGAGFAWAIWRTDDLTIAPKVGYENADIPTQAAGFAWHLHVGNRAGAAAYGICFMQMELWNPN